MGGILEIFYEVLDVLSNIYATWNIMGYDKKYYDIQNRTNNALERYNCRMNDMFSSPHPALLHFVDTIEVEARSQVTKLDNIRNGHQGVVKSRRKSVNIGVIPACYHSFNPPNNS